jgi:hypothetical protein
MEEVRSQVGSEKGRRWAEGARGGDVGWSGVRRVNELGFAVSHNPYMLERGAESKGEMAIVGRVESCLPPWANRAYHRTVCGRATLYGLCLG